MSQVCYLVWLVVLILLVILVSYNLHLILAQLWTVPCSISQIAHLTKWNENIFIGTLWIQAPDCHFSMVYKVWNSNDQILYGISVIFHMKIQIIKKSNKFVLI